MAKKHYTTRGGLPLTYESYWKHCDAQDGYCLACRRWVLGGVEPDARQYECPACGEREVYGAEELLMMAKISVA